MNSCANARAVQGYIDAARAFQKEAGIEAGFSDEVADVRMHVRNALEQGHVDEAIEQVNDLNPEVRSAKISMLHVLCWLLVCLARLPLGTTTRVPNRL